ncbi:SAG-related sequence SRS55M [Toxoplasma gondii TgCatPRC2]|uniref:SAG-related sequence SRS55M n=1 Tax=Toxoplasma gondii TgCatPRC2 TaxID=1130821 RepID=A0A151HLH5_TOXGO|nr:SAG-related sequence SRS55M [Toxoplasma gondii TgCatPRC2]
MEGTMLRGVPASKGLRNAVRVSLLIGLVCLSARAAASPVAVTCSKGVKFVAGSLNKLQSQVELQCPEHYSLYPTKQSNKFCKNASCIEELALSVETVSWEARSDTEELPSRKQAGGNVLTLVEYPTKSQTLYFQCRKTSSGPVQQENRVASEPEETPGETCVMQVAVYGTRAAATKDEENVCTIGNDKSVTLNSTSNKVTFRCASDADTLSTINFEEALRGDSCDQTVKLADLKLSASLVEGMSATSSTNAVPYSEIPAADATDLPTYTFEVIDFPTNEVKLCYKCIEKAVHPILHPQPSKECKVLITVDAKPAATPEGPGEDTQPPTQEGSEEKPGQPEQEGDANSGKPGETPNGTDEKPSGSQSPSGSSARKSTTGVWILALLIMFLASAAMS